MDKRVLLTQPSNPIPVDFVAIAGHWCADYSTILLNHLWQGYDKLLEDQDGLNKKSLERSITGSLAWRISDALDGYEPYVLQHEAFEFETMKTSQAQPPQYDLAFKLRAKDWIMWPLEAKVIESDEAVDKYRNDLTNEFLTCRYAPFSSEGAMLGYLLKGSAENVFRNLEEKIPCSFAVHPGFKDRPCKMSDHVRQVEAGKPYPSRFRCYHLILEFPGVTRQNSQKPTSRKESKR